jgi:hypothetical protein
MSRKDVAMKTYYLAQIRLRGLRHWSNVGRKLGLYNSMYHVPEVCFRSPKAARRAAERARTTVADIRVVGVREVVVS